MVVFRFSSGNARGSLTSTLTIPAGGATHALLSKARHTLLLLAWSLYCTHSPLCYAQADSSQEVAAASRIDVLHTPSTSADIPPVGSLMRITLALTNTTDIESKVRLVGAKDGRFIDIAFPRGALSNVDKPTFTAEIPSPVALMTYQFIVHQSDGTLTTSRTFVIKRQCIQNFTVKVIDDKSTTTFRKEVASLIAEANRLERDNKSLDASLKLLEEMKTTFSQ